MQTETKCLYCNHRIVPASDGTCPKCTRQITDKTLDPDQELQFYCRQCDEFFSTDVMKTDSTKRGAQHVNPGVSPRNLKQEKCCVPTRTMLWLPDLYNGTFLEHPRYAPDEFHYHSWRTIILPQLEQTTLYDRIDFSSPATVAANQSIANTTLSVFVCSSTSNPNPVVPGILAFPPQLSPPIIGTAARSDYEVIGGVSFSPLVRPTYGMSNSVHGASPELTALSPAQ